MTGYCEFSANSVAGQLSLNATDVPAHCENAAPRFSAEKPQGGSMRRRQCLAICKTHLHFANRGW